MNQYIGGDPNEVPEGFVVILGATVDHQGHIERLWFHGRSVSNAESLHLTFPASPIGYRIAEITQALEFFSLVLDGNAADVQGP